MANLRTTITVSTAQGELEGVPVMVDYDVTHNPRDRETGNFQAWDEVTSCEIITVQIGGWNAGRIELVEMCGEEEVARQEDMIAERITEDLMTGELEAA